MKTFCRKTYNSHYYAQNRERILKRRNSQKPGIQPDRQTLDDLNQLSLFEPSTPKLNTSKRFKRFNFEFAINILLFLLVIANSYFLLSEAIEFYQSNNSSVETSVLAAVSVELLLLALSVIQTSNRVLKIAAKTALILLFIYSAWSFCSTVISRGHSALEQLSAVERKIARVEAQIKERNVLIEENLKLHRVTMARRLTLEKDQLNAELTELENQRTEQISVPPSTQRINTLSMVVLRLLLQLSNIIIVHHLSEFFRPNPKRSAPKTLRAAAPVFHLVPRALDV